MEFYRERRVNKSKRWHQCHICGDVMDAGRAYWYESGKHNGNFFTRATCDLCHTIRDKMYEAENISEYDTLDISAFVANDVCSNCDDYDDCDLSVFDCRKVREHYLEGEE